MPGPDRTDTMTIDDSDPMTTQPVSANGSVAASPPILEAKDVTMAFGGVKALSSVSASFLDGQICGLIGPNGAGKTTFFDCLTGIRRPTSGSVHFEGQDVTGRS